jgi:hypothetical protein
VLEYLPQMSVREVTIGGFAVPQVEARESDDGVSCSITLDRRFGIDVPADIAAEVIWLIANAMAIGAGYSCHGANSVRSNPFKVKVMEVETR